MGILHLRRFRRHRRTRAKERKNGIPCEPFSNERKRKRQPTLNTQRTIPIPSTNRLLAAYQRARMTA